jgi:nucleoside-diphosphate-sugar epimerase
MRVLITGGNGAVGKAVVARLASHGHAVKVIGRSSGVEIPGAAYESVDINDFARLRAATRGFDAIVHLAAVPNPAAESSDKVFEANAQGTFNLYKAAEEEGIRRVVQASSINALGVFYGLKPAPIHYLPVDEAHPCVSSDVYSFSKHVIEEIGDYYWRRAGISGVALRLPWVAPAAYHQANPARQQRLRRQVDALLALSAEERGRWYAGAWDHFNELREMGVLEDFELMQNLRTAEPDWFGDDWQAMMNRVNFFTCLDERDSAQAVELALTGSYEGSHTLFVNDDHNWTGVPSATLAEVFYPDVREFKTPLEGTGTLVSIQRAQELLGFKVEYSFE